MQKKILILGLGAFGFAVAKYLGENNPEITIFASEINPEIYMSISETRRHPYFFNGVELPDNIELISDAGMKLPEIDIVISIIPCQFIGGAFGKMRDSLKPGVTLLNLSKGIDNQSLQTVSEKLSEVLEEVDYSYAYLAGGMIAAELVEGKQLGADIVTENTEIGETLKKLFDSKSLEIHLKIGSTKNTELYAALKNIIALILGYYEGTGAEASTRGYYFSKLLDEMKGIISLLSGDENIVFSDFAFSGDLIATCFGDSRNRLLGNMLGEGIEISPALEKLKKQNKIAEGYETLKGVYSLTQGKTGFTEINNFGEKFLI